MKCYSIFLLLLLVGCGSSEDTETDTTDATEAQDVETVFDPLIESIDKAKAVEDIVMQQKQQMDEALKKMEGETDDSDQ
ncbi:MAG: hypothetical protein IIB76_09990 [Proteobacteria bacterium]|nr:hypothetical protein [Pseudomonadota bacterium]